MKLGSLPNNEGLLRGRSQLRAAARGAGPEAADVLLLCPMATARSMVALSAESQWGVRRSRCGMLAQQGGSRICLAQDSQRARGGGAQLETGLSASPCAWAAHMGWIAAAFAHAAALDDHVSATRSFGAQGQRVAVEAPYFVVGALK